MKTTELRKAFRFFLEHAGYGTPPGRAACALDLARAERDGAARDWHVTWHYDEADAGMCSPADERYGRDACDVCGLLPTPQWGNIYDERDSRCVSSPRYGYPSCPGEHSVQWAALRDEDDNILATLGGIVDADEDYQRVVAAELASEALHDVRTAETNDREASRYMAL